MIYSLGNSRSLLLFTFFLTCSLSGLSQSTAEVEKERIITIARKQLVAMSAAGGELYEMCAKNSITGDFVVDLTIGTKGKMLTVFMVSSNPESITNQNFLKSKLSDLQFEDIKIPKTERIKFRHTLTF